MAKKKKRSNRPKGIPLALAGGALAGVVISYTGSNNIVPANDLRQFGKNLLASYLGFDVNTGKFSLALAYNGLAPLAAGVAIHKAAGYFRVNQILSRNNIPLVRI